MTSPSGRKHLVPHGQIPRPSKLGRNLGSHAPPPPPGPSRSQTKQKSRLSWIPPAWTNAVFSRLWGPKGPCLLFPRRRRGKFWGFLRPKTGCFKPFWPSHPSGVRAGEPVLFRGWGPRSDHPASSSGRGVVQQGGGESHQDPPARTPRCAHQHLGRNSPVTPLHPLGASHICGASSGLVQHLRDRPRTWHSPRAPRPSKPP